MMRLSTLKYFTKDAAKSVVRNRSVSLASFLTVSAALVILGIFMLALLDVNQGVKSVESSVRVKVFLKDGITESQKNDIEDKIKSVDGVVNVTYENKNDALKDLKNQVGEKNKDILAGLESDNPLPCSYVVKVEKTDVITNVVNTIKDMQGVDTIEDGRGVVKTINHITNVIKFLGAVVFGVLLVISIFLIGNTIKITLYSRKKEINIMKYIGATDWFIRVPFIMEGMFIGITSAIFAAIILYLGYGYIYFKSFANVFIVNFVSPSFIFTGLLWIFIVVGILIGSIGSILSIRKFLRV